MFWGGFLNSHAISFLPFLKLEDLSFPFHRPSVLDLKMGTQTYDEEATPEKVAAEMAKYPPQRELGFRFTGMRVHQVDTGVAREFDRFYGRDLHAGNAIEGFRNFLQNGQGVRYELVPALLAGLALILDWFERQRAYRFYAASLLLVYEGDPTLPAKVTLRLIDFAHATDAADGRADDGFIHGLNQTIALLRRLQGGETPVEV